MARRPDVVLNFWDIGAAVSAATLGPVLRVVDPARELASFIDSLWFVEDLPGARRGHVVRTIPTGLPALTFNLGVPNLGDDGEPVPRRISLLGCQTSARAWVASSSTYFVMAFLTVRGVVALFPGLGVATRDRAVELACVMGARRERALHRALVAAWTPARVQREIETWLRGQLEQDRDTPQRRRLITAHQQLARGGGVEAAARRVERSRRQLGRWFRAHLGVGPKTITQIERIRASVRAARRGEGDPAQGFADQAHQIRSWRARLGVTPGAYRRRPPSTMAALEDETGSRAAFYL